MLLEATVVAILAAAINSSTKYACFTHFDLPEMENATFFSSSTLKWKMHFRNLDNFFLKNYMKFCNYSHQIIYNALSI